MLILLPEVVKTPGGWHEGCKYHCTVAPSRSMLLLLGKSHKYKGRHHIEQPQPLRLDTATQYCCIHLTHNLSLSSDLLCRFHLCWIPHARQYVDSYFWILWEPNNICFNLFEHLCQEQLCHWFCLLSPSGIR
jgi:hypothetical protein